MDAKYIKCAAKCCGNTLLERSDVKFFTFPEDDNLAKVWAKHANISSYQYGSTLCSEHFENKYFNDTYGKKSVFKSDVQPIPTIFNKKIIKTEDNSTTNTMAQKITTQTEKVLGVPPLEFYEYCRLCATQMPALSLISLFNTSNNFKELIDICLPGKLSTSDNLSHAICITCTEKLKSCASILMQFQEADKKLRSLHPTPSTSKERTKGSKKRKEAVINRVMNTPSDSEEGTDTELIDAIKELDDEETDNVLEFLENMNKILEKIVPDDIDDIDTTGENEFDTADDNTIDLTEDNDFEIDEAAKSKINKVPESTPTTKNIVENKSIIKKNALKFQCISCTQVFDTKDKIVLHAFHDHPENRGNKLISTVIKSSVWVKQDDTQMYSSGKIYQCAVCNLTLRSEESVIRHTQFSHKHISSDDITVKVTDPRLCDIIKYMCVNCPQIFDTKRAAQYHGNAHHPKSKIISRSIVVKKGKDPVTHVFPFRQNNLNVKINRTFNSLFRNDAIATTGHHNHYGGRRSELLNEPLKTFHIKYKCKTCPDMFKTYKEVLDHYTEKHSESLEQSGPFALVVKVENTDKTDDKGSIITVQDETIFEVDPSLLENRSKPGADRVITIKKYKCLKCPKLYPTKKQIIQHNISVHPTPDTKEIKCKVIAVNKKVNYIGKKHERHECLICCSHHTTIFSLIHHTRLLHPDVHKQKFLCRFIQSKNLRSEPKQCLRCNVVPTNYTRYRQHMHKHISFPCETCGANFTKIFELRYHIRNEHELKPAESTEPELHKCIVCDQEFNSKSELLKHEKQHKVPKDVQCTKCNKRFNHDYELKKHELNYHETCLCHECGKTYEKPYIRQHLQTHNRDFPYKCKMVNCTREFKTQSSMFRHQRAHVRKNNNTICQICGKIVSRSSLTLHMKIHSVVRNEVCDICGAAFYRKDHLRHHRKRHTQLENPRDNTLYLCPLCNITLQNKNAYMSHVTITHGIEHPGNPKKNKSQPEKNLACVICEKKFAYRCYLEEHYLQHKGERVFKCDVCNKGFTTRIVLYQHKLTHLPYEQLRHQCDICDKKFRRRGQLVDHRRVHTGEKPFPCPVCKRPFRVRGEMVKHMRIHARNSDARIARHKRKRPYPKSPSPSLSPPPIDETSEEHSILCSNAEEESKENTSSEQVVISAKKTRVVNKIIRKNNTIFLIEEDSNSLDHFGDNMPSLD